MKHIVRWAQKINISSLAYLYYSYDFLSHLSEVSR